MPNRQLRMCNNPVCNELTKDAYWDKHNHIERDQIYRRKDKALNRLRVFCMEVEQ